MRRLGGHDPVQRIQFHLWVIWNLCFIKKTWARWYKTTVAYLLSTILRILLGFATLRCGMLCVHPQKDAEIAHRATPSKYWFSRCSVFFGGESAKWTPPNFDFQMFVVKLNYQHLVFSVFFWSLLIEITNLLVTTLDTTIRHIIPSGFKHFYVFQSQYIYIYTNSSFQTSKMTSDVLVFGGDHLVSLDDSTIHRPGSASPQIATGLEHLGNGPRISGSCWISW